MNEARSTDFCIGQAMEAPAAALVDSALMAAQNRRGDGTEPSIGSDEPSPFAAPSWGVDKARGSSLVDEAGGAARVLSDLVADEDAANRSQDLDADLSRLTPLVVEHQAHITGTPTPLVDAPEAAAGLDVSPLTESSPARPAVQRTDRLANAILGLFLVGLIAFLGGAGLSVAVLNGHLESSQIKEIMQSIKHIAMQLSDLV